MDFLDLATKKIVVFGLANRKSVACAIAKLLQGQGAEVIHVVRSPARRETAEKLEVSRNYVKSFKEKLDM